MPRIFALSVFLLAAVFPTWAGASEVTRAAEAASPLVRAVFERNQAEAVRLIRSGVPIDPIMDEVLVDEHLNKPARMLSYHNNTPPGYPLAIAVALLGMPGVLEAIGEREPALLHVADSDNKTAINYAAHQGYANTVAVLLRHGLNPLQPPHHHWASGTPLSRAAMAGHASVVKLLLDAIPKAQYGSDRVTEQVWTAAGFPSQGHKEVVRVLLDAGVSPNYIALQGGTALVNAIRNRDPAQVRLLIAHGAKAYDHYYRGRTVKEWAAYYAGPEASPAAKEVAELVGALETEPSSWQKAPEVEEFEKSGKSGKSE